MSGDGAPDQEVFDASALKVAIVAASWHTQVMDGLLAGAERALTEYGVTQHRTDRVVRVGLDHTVAIGFGVLTCDNDQQALERAGLAHSREDKGYEAASAALLTARTLKEIAASTP